MPLMKKIVKCLAFILLPLFALVYIFCSFFGIGMAFDDAFGRVDFPEYSAYIRYDDIKNQYSREKINFSSGENTLTGFIYNQNSGNKGLVVISHGMGGFSETYLGETMYFADHGYTVFAFDNTGSGYSEGNGTVGMAQSAIDLDAALDYVESNDKLKGLPLLLYGHSWGGYAVMAVLKSEHDITASVSVSGYNTPVEVMADAACGIMPKFAVYAEYPFIWLHNRLRFGKYADNSAIDAINSTDAYVLVIHGKNDKSIGYESASIISHRNEIVNPNAFCRTVGGEYSGHDLLRLSEEDAEYAVKVTDDFEELSRRYSGQIPEREKAKFFEAIDKRRMSIPSEEFMGNIDEHYRMAIDKRKQS